MGRIDVKSRLYLQQKELFADAFNYYIYDGNPVIQPEKLAEQDISELSVHYESDAKETIVQRYRNVLKLTILTEDHQTAYLMPGLEAQNQVHYAIPVRNMLYDATMPFQCGICFTMRFDIKSRWRSWPLFIENPGTAGATAAENFSPVSIEMTVWSR